MVKYVHIVTDSRPLLVAAIAHSHLIPVASHISLFRLSFPTSKNDSAAVNLAVKFSKFIHVTDNPYDNESDILLLFTMSTTAGIAGIHVKKLGKESMQEDTINYLN